MREILFRGKRIDNGEWVYGYYVFRRKRRGIFGQTITELDFDTHYIVSARGESFEVDPETVGMCVPGITDKNGKRIFEGDILSVLLDFEHGRTIKGIVEYKIDCFRIKYNNPNGVGALTLNPISYERNHIIIGNIYDNPELLEVGE